MICQGCKQEVKNFHRHHIVPKSLGGVDEDCNIAILCEPCHGKVHNRRFVDHSHLTKAGLERAKAKGIKLGGNRPNNQARHKAVKAMADQNALRVSKLIKDYRRAGKSYRYIAGQLNELSVATARAGKWHASTVRNYEKRLENE
jgi:hypothetical protein